MATPMMTPSYSYTTPSQQALGTPQYPGSTPQSSHGHSSHHAHHSAAPGPASGTPTSSSASRGRTPQQPKYVAVTTSRFTGAGGDRKHQRFWGSP